MVRVRGYEPVSTGAIAQVLPSHKNQAEIRTMLIGQSTWNSDVLDIISNGDGENFVVLMDNRPVTLIELLDMGFIGSDASFDIQEDLELIITRHFERVMARIAVHRVSLGSGESVLILAQDDAYMSGTHAVSRRPVELLEALGISNIVDNDIDNVYELNNNPNLKINKLRVYPHVEPYWLNHVKILDIVYELNKIFHNGVAFVPNEAELVFTFKLFPEVLALTRPPQIQTVPVEIVRGTVRETVAALTEERDNRAFVRIGNAPRIENIDSGVDSYYGGLQDWFELLERLGAELTDQMVGTGCGPTAAANVLFYYSQTILRGNTSLSQLLAGRSTESVVPSRLEFARLAAIMYFFYTPQTVFIPFQNSFKSYGIWFMPTISRGIRNFVDIIGIRLITHELNNFDTPQYSKAVEFIETGLMNNYPVVLLVRIMIM